jgi:hypothetical protein
MRIKITVLAVFYLFLSYAQNTTINRGKTEESKTSHRVMLVPFEPKLYNSEIDYAINRETKLSAKEIRFKFRDGLNEQLYKIFKSSKYGVIDLMEDTLKYKKEIISIYQNLSYEYMKVPDQTNYKPPVKEKKEKTIEKGQLNIETKTDVRFMNSKITDARLVPLLYAKYKTDVFVFINQLDVKAGNTNPEFSNGMMSENRKIVVHYTVYTYDAKEINSGIAEQEFPFDINNPSKIVDKYFPKVAETIHQRVQKALSPTK